MFDDWTARDIMFAVLLCVPSDGVVVARSSFVDSRLLADPPMALTSGDVRTRARYPELVSLCKSPFFSVTLAPPTHGLIARLRFGLARFSLPFSALPASPVVSPFLSFTWPAKVTRHRWQFGARTRIME